jgi:hypothetical protein
VSPRLALCLFIAICIAELALRVSQAIDAALAWPCPHCDHP